MNDLIYRWNDRNGDGAVETRLNDDHILINNLPCPGRRRRRWPRRRCRRPSSGPAASACYWAPRRRRWRGAAGAPRCSLSRSSSCLHAPTRRCGGQFNDRFRSKWGRKKLSQRRSRPRMEEQVVVVVVPPWWWSAAAAGGRRPRKSSSTGAIDGMAGTCWGRCLLKIMLAVAEGRIEERLQQAWWVWRPAQIKINCWAAIC